MRNIAEEYLDDANLWQEILQASGLKSSAEVKTGMRLKIPQNAISLATTELAASVEAIRKATDAGARIFSSKIIEEAVNLRQQALVQRKQGNWGECQTLAKNSHELAKKALKETLSKREQSAEAVLRDGTGKVQARKVKDLVWNSIERDAILIEKEKVRTMSDSSAEILFADESRLRLGPNSQAEIQTMRVDRLNRKQESRVSLVQGDIYAMLGKSKKKKDFKVEVPGISVDSGSSKYWMSRQGKQVKIANYDKLNMAISSAGKTVLLSLNQGTIVEEGKAPSAVIDLLKAPGIISPAENHTFLTNRIDLEWTPVEGAIAFRIDVSKDPSFETMAYVNPNVRGTKLQLENFADGLYYWRVSAVDVRGLPGKHCEKKRFRVAKDNVAPYLCIKAPERGTITREGLIQFEGIVEFNAPLYINNEPVKVNEEGAFQIELPLQLGLNSFTLTAEDLAGNITEKTRSIFYTADQPLMIHYDSHLPRRGEQHFLANSIFRLSASTSPNVRVEVFQNSGIRMGSTVSNQDGWFQMFLPIQTKEQRFRIHIRDASGAESDETFSVTRDLDPPLLKISSEVPQFTNNRVFPLTGYMENGETLYFNGEPVVLKHGQFSISANLKPGPNSLNLTAEDALGNVSFWDHTITLDEDPPQLIHSKVLRNQDLSNDAIGFSVIAKDATGLKRLTTLRYVIGSVSQSLVLKRNVGSNEYRGSLHLHENSKGTIRIQHVVLEDYLGNRKVYLLK